MGVKNEKLIKKLERVVIMARDRDGTFDLPSDNFFDAESFAIEIEDLIRVIKDSNKGVTFWLKAFFKRKKAKRYFKPTYDFDDFCYHHEDSLEVGEYILSQL